MNQTDEEKYWNGRYTAAGDDYLFGTAANKFVTRQGERLQPGMTALSVADGEGRNSVWMAEEGLAVTALEFSPIALHKAQRLAVERHVAVDFILADVLQWDWPEAAYDVVLGVFIQFATPEQRALLFSAMEKALKPGGLLLLHGYTPKQLEFKTGGPSKAEYMYTEALLRDAFPDLEFLELTEYEDMLKEGSGSQRHHSGRSALIDMIARKPG